MLRALGAEVAVEDRPDGARAASVRGGPSLAAQSVVVPGDPSSAAFPLVAALITPGSEVTVEGVLLNPLRTGLFDDAARDGRRPLASTNGARRAARRSADVTARHRTLSGVEVPPERAPSMIDEYPILAVAAAFAAGPTVMRGLGEMRVKESDRIAAMARGPGGLRRRRRGQGDDADRRGRRGRRLAAARDRRPLRPPHRHEPLVLGARADEPVTVDERRA